MANQSFKIVLAGCGGISAAWLDAIGTIPAIRVVGLVDLQQTAARRRQEQYQLTDAAIGTDLARLLDATQPDAVFDCTVPAARASVVVAALEAGCHVLSEKPMAATLCQAHRLIDIADKAGRIFAVMQNRRFDPHLQVLRHTLASGELGKLTTLNADFYLGAHFGGFRDEMEHVLLLDMAIHSFDQARCICGADPVSVYCREWNPQESWYAHGASAVALFEMSNGAVFTYRGSWCAEGLNTSWQCNWRAVGTRGTATWDGEALLLAQRVKEDSGFIRPMEDLPIPPLHGAGAQQTGHARCIADFIECLQNGRLPETICTDNVKSLAMVFGGIESAQHDRRITISV
jgi:predicted dehydrogenase